VAEAAEQRPWERLPGEPLRWYERFTAFRLMEPVRSVAQVYYAEHPTLKHAEGRRKIPGDWYSYARKWNWEARATAYDEEQAKELEQQIAAERTKVMTSGLSLMHKRLQLLNHLTLQLVSMTKDEDKVWIPDVKAIGTGPNAKQVNLRNFNDALYREIREYLTDISEEMGERVKKSELSAKVHTTGQVGVYLPQKYEMSEVSGKEELPAAPPAAEQPPPTFLPDKYTLEERTNHDDTDET
jgi:hypothetical protein